MRKKREGKQMKTDEKKCQILDYLTILRTGTE